MLKTKKKDLRIEILEATRSLLLEDGLDNISMRKIASRIGCKAPSIYYYFRNKDALIHALIEEGNERLYDALQEARSEDRSPLDNLEENWRAFVAFGLEQHVYYHIMFFVKSEEIAHFPKDAFRRARKTLEPAVEILEQCKNHGVLTVKDPAMTAMANGAMLHGFISLVLMERLDRGWDRDQMLNHIIDHIFAGMGIGGTHGRRVPLSGV